MNKTSKSRLDAQKRYYNNHKEEIAARSKEKYEATKHLKPDLTDEQKLRRSELNREFRLMKEYGITGAEYQRLLNEQGCVCAICGSADKYGRNLAVDHCHNTGLVRGLLCTHCNTGIGVLGDTSDSVFKAYEYLKRAEQKELSNGNKRRTN